MMSSVRLFGVCAIKYSKAQTNGLNLVKFDMSEYLINISRGDLKYSITRNFRLTQDKNTKFQILLKLAQLL